MQHVVRIRAITVVETAKQAQKIRTAAAYTLSQAQLGLVQYGTVHDSSARTYANIAAWLNLLPTSLLRLPSVFQAHMLQRWEPHTSNYDSAAVNRCLT
jgi:hypothetical protein